MLRLPSCALFLFGFFLFSSCQQDTSEKINVAVAANVQFPMETIAQAFFMETGLDCNLIVGSSGKLTAQIKNGADFDLFLSANMKYPDDLFANGFTVEEPQVYAYGKLVLWTLERGIMPSIDRLLDPAVKHIALANPRNAPYGEAALAILKNAQVYNELEEKLVYGESISQTNQFITSGAAQIGFTAKSVVLSIQMDGQGSWLELDDRLYDPLAQGMVLINKEEGPSKTALRFYEFMTSARAQGILGNFGYGLTPDE